MQNAILWCSLCFRTVWFSKIALKTETLSWLLQSLYILHVHILCVHTPCMSMCVCVRLYAPSAWMLLLFTATDVPCQGAATWVSDLSHCGMALFDDKRVLKTLSSLWGDNWCSNTASNLSWAVAGAVMGWCVFFTLILSFSLLAVFPQPFLHLNGLTLCPLLSSTKWIHAIAFKVKRKKRVSCP